MNEFAVDGGNWFGLPLAASPWPVQVFAILLLAAAGSGLVWYLVKKQSRSVGLDFTAEIWPRIKDDPKAVVLYRLGIYAMFTIIVATLFSRFA